MTAEPLTPSWSFATIFVRFLYLLPASKYSQNSCGCFGFTSLSHCNPRVVPMGTAFPNIAHIHQPSSTLCPCFINFKAIVISWSQHIVALFFLAFIWVSPRTLQVHPKSSHFTCHVLLDQFSHIHVLVACAIYKATFVMKYRPCVGEQFLGCSFWGFPQVIQNCLQIRNAADKFVSGANIFAFLHPDT